MSDALASSFSGFGSTLLRPSLSALFRAWFARETIHDPRALAEVGLENLV